MTLATKTLAKPGAAQDKVGLGNSAKIVIDAVKDLEKVKNLHKARQDVMQFKIDMAAKAGNQVKVKELSVRKVRKASEMTAKIQTLGKEHEGLFNKLANHGNRVA